MLWLLSRDLIPIVHALNRFDANLLKILYGILGDTSNGLAMPMVQQTCAFQGCVSPKTIQLVQAALAKGFTHWLASCGGWRNQRHLRGDHVASGSVWQRTPPQDLGLTFSPASMRFLIWLTANDPRSDSADPWTKMIPDQLTLGDQLLLLRTLEFLKEDELGHRWFRIRKFAALPLVALSYPDLIAARVHPVEVDFGSVLPELAWVLECLQPWLVERWTEVENSKGRIADTDQMCRLGAQQSLILKSYLAAVRQHGRRDLARFLLLTLQRLVGSEIPPKQWARRWIGSLRLGDMRLAERTIVYQSASSFLSIAHELRACTEDCRQVGYFDEGYAAAQLWLADWERYDGENSTLRALAMLSALSV